MSNISRKPFIDDRTGKLIIPEGHLLFRNFSGREGQYNREGDKSFCVFIDDPDLADRMKFEGWNVRMTKPRDEGDVPRPYIQVMVSYRYRPPRVYMHTHRNTVSLDQDSITSLDYADIIGADLVINPSRWTINGTSGIKAYLETLHVVIEEDYFAEKYAEEEYPRE